MNALKVIGNIPVLGNSLRRLLICISVYFLQFCYLNATHIVGGQLSYRSLGHNYYEITVVFRRDCKPGTEPFDTIAVLGIFYTDNQKAYNIGHDGISYMYLNEVKTLSDTVPDICAGKSQLVCVQQTVYKDTLYLPEDDYNRGYILAYQRCCRNSNLLNIVDPLNTGSTYTATITPANLKQQNSNPDFGLVFPPIYICANKPFIFNHSAIDRDSDLLVYSLCAPYKGKTMQNPAGRPDFPPFDTVQWRFPYDINNILGSALTIDSTTGMISAYPKITGQFVVGICVNEYDKVTHELKGYSRRDFELNVVACGKKPVALFERNSLLCDGLNVSFKNLSTDGIEYLWYFDWLNDKSQTSTSFNPNHLYSKPGQYEVVLVVKNENCSDTTSLTIKVIDPNLKADFDYNIDCKQFASLHITDKSTANGQIVRRDWTLTGQKDTLSSNQKDPVFNLKGDGKITITLKITDSDSCTTFISKTIDIQLVKLDLFGDTTICRGDSARLVKNPNSNYTYQWNPTNTLDLHDPSNPVAKPNNTTTYSVTITDGSCSTVKQITVTVRDKIHLTISKDTLPCDGKADIFVHSDSSTIFIWSLNPSFNPVIFTGDHYIDTLSGTKKFYIKAGRSDQCPDSISIMDSDHALRLSYTNKYTVCALDTLNIHVANANQSDTLHVVWQPDSIIISGKNTLSPVIVCPAPGKYVLHFSIRNQFDCFKEDSIVITAVSPPIPDFTKMNDCGSLTVKLNTLNGGSVTWDFGDNSPTSHEKTTSHTYGTHGVYKITLTVDSVCARSITKLDTVVELSLTNLKDSVMSCLGDSVYLNPGANPKYHYQWTPTTGLNDPTSPNPYAKVTSNTVYKVKITDPDFPDYCSIEDSIWVIVPPLLTLKAEPDTVLCDKVKITLKVSANLSGTEFEWYDRFGHPIGKGSTVDVMPDTSTYYIVKAIDPFGCKAQDTVNIELFNLNATISGPDIICFGDSTFIVVHPGAGTNYHYEWSPIGSIIGSNTDSIVHVRLDNDTKFTVKIRNDHNCEWELTKEVSVSNPQRVLHVQATPDTIVAGQVSHLTATQDSLWKYLWRPNNDGSLKDSTIYNPDVTPVKTTTYTVTITDENGCTATASVTVTLKTCEESVFLPNAFSPNNDGINDKLYLRVRDSSVTKMELVIYSRWGEKIFSTTDYSIPWDGRYKDKELPPDVFGYALKYTCHDKREYLKKGNINLIK